MRCAAARSRCRRVRSSWVLPFVGSTAPIAAFMATKGGGRTGPAPAAKRRAEAQRRMAGAGYFASRCKGGLCPPTENSRPSAIAGPGRLPPRSPSQKAVGAVLSDKAGKHHDRMRHDDRRRRGHHLPVPVHAANSMKRATSSGAICTRNAARSASMPSVRRSSLKSPSRGDRAIASIPASFARSIRLAIAPSPGRIVVAGDIEPAQRRWEQDGGEMRGRERGHHRHGGHDASERQHGLDAFASRQDSRRHDHRRHAETDGVAQQMAHRPPWRVDRRLVAARWDRARCGARR